MRSAVFEKALARHAVEPWTPFEDATVFKTASSASRTRSVCEMAPPLGIAPSSHRLTGGPHTLCVERNALRGSAHRKPRSALCIAVGMQLLPAGVAPASFRLEDGCLWSARPRERMKWSRASVLPRVSPRPKRGGLLSSSRASRSCRVEMAACAGIAPAEEAEGNSGGRWTGEPTFRSTGGCSS